MNPLQLILGTYNSHQHGERAEHIENRYQNTYRPALKAFYRCPDVAFTLYYSGILLEWLDTHHSEFLSALSEMYQYRRLELLMGAFAEPLLPLIPRPDRLAQFEYTSTLMRRIFGKRIRGAWLEPMIWDQETVSSLNSAGLEYVFLDDYHFEKSGLPQADVHPPVISDDQGKPVLVLPVSNKLSRMCWRVAPREIIDRIMQLAERYPGEVLSLIFPGESEQEGMPASEEERDAWLGEFLEGIQALQTERLIKTIHPGKYVRKAKSRPHLYFQATQFMEMEYWSSDTDDRKTYNSSRASMQRGSGVQGYFYAKSIRQQLSRYVESRLLYAKMQYVHTMVNQIKGDRYRRDAGREELWRGQCHIPYWHGLQGGIYQTDLRAAAYSSLLKAERHTREKGVFSSSVSALDFDLDGLEEFLYLGNEINAYIHLKGGALFELDYLPGAVNYLATMARYPEPYHDLETRNEGYDSLPYWSFLDNFHINPKAAGTPIHRRDTLIALGGNEYSLEEFRKESRTLCFLLSTELKMASHSWPISLRKTYTFNKSQIFVSYQIQNQGNSTLDAFFCPEINLSLLAQKENKLRMYRKNAGVEEELDPDSADIPVSQMLYFEDHLNRTVIHCLLGQEAEWWNVKNFSSFQKNGRSCKEYQNNSLYPKFHLVLEPGFTQDLDISLSIERMRGASLLN